MIESLKILLIEDDKVDAKNFERVLNDTEFKCVFKHLNNIEDGFIEIQNSEYDLVFLDYHLPKGNGLSLLKSLDGVGINVPTVIITSYADPHIAVEMIQAGASDYIPKSLLNVDGLSQCIRSCVRVNALEKKKEETEVRLKKVEDRLGTIISNTPIILFVLDKNGDFRLGIGKHWDSFNPTSFSVIGLKFIEVYSEYHDLIENAKKALEGQIRKCVVEIDDIVFEVTLTPQKTSSGENEVLGLALDITDHDRGQKSLENAKEIAENASKLKQEFIANMSHEIRTPMNAIIGFTNLLVETKMSVLQNEFVNAIKVSGENLLTLVNDILDFSKIEAGKLNLEQKNFELSEVVESVCKILEGKAKEKKIKLKFKIDEHIPVALKGDSGRIYQVLMNLAGNSVKFTQKGFVSIKAKLKQETLKNVVIEFEVSDTGVGIPSDKKDLIFDSFIQVEGESNRRYGGTGLGLTIVKNLIDLMNGQIKVKSEMGVGSSFKFTIPLGFADSSYQLKKQGVDLKNKFKNLKGKRILLAEDNAMNQKLVIMYLRKYEIQIDLAETGFQALKALKSNDYDLILMDVQMPDMDGIEATQEIRTKFSANKRNVPILAMTAHAFKEEIANCFAVGMNAHISKPIDKEAFLTLISSLVTESTNDISGNQNVTINESENHLKTQVVDLSYLRDMAEGNEGFVQEMVRIFKDDSPKLIAKMRENFDDNDWKALSKVAHKYRSPAVMMGMKEVATLAEKVEYNDYEKDNSEEIGELISLIEKRSMEAINYIQTNF